jgi:hypothetical protein
VGGFETRGSEKAPLKRNTQNSGESIAMCGHAFENGPCQRRTIDMQALGGKNTGVGFQSGASSPCSVHGAAILVFKMLAGFGQVSGYFSVAGCPLPAGPARV